MSQLLNESEQRLVAELGIYGCWLLRWGPSLNQELLEVKAIMNAYQDYATQIVGMRGYSGLKLFDRIQEYVNLYPELFIEPLATYPEALEDLLAFRGTLEKP